MILKIPKNLLFLAVFILGISLFSAYILSASTRTYTLISPTSGSTYATVHGFIINVSVSPLTLGGKCNYTIGLINGSWAMPVNATMTNGSIIYWANATIIPEPIETGYGTTLNNSYNNITFVCNTTTQLNDTSSVYYFKIDTTDPSVSFQKNANGMNFTTASTGIWNWTFNYTDNNYATCGLRYYQYPSTSTYVFISGATANAINGLNSKANCTLLFDPNSTILSNVRTEGEFKLEGFGNDTMGHSAVTSTNFTGIMTKIYGSKYNLITFRGANRTSDSNETVYNFVNDTFGYATIISVWNNLYGNFTTFSTSTPSINNDINLTVGTAFYMYSSASGWLIQPDQTPPSGNIKQNISLYINTSQKGNSWNQMGLFNNVTMNNTLYACTYNATSLNHTSGTCISSSSMNISATFNITYVSWLNASTGQLVTCKRGFSICSGGANPNAIVLKEGYAVWVMPNANITINRSSIY